VSAPTKATRSECVAAILAWLEEHTDFDGWYEDGKTEVADMLERIIEDHHPPRGLAE